MLNHITFEEILLPLPGIAFTSPDDGRSIFRNLVLLNILVRDVINVVYYYDTLYLLKKNQASSIEAM